MSSLQESVDSLVAKDRINAPISITEFTPLLSRCEQSTFENVQTNRTTIFWEEVPTIFRSTLPIVCTQLMEHSLVFVPVISIGHISTSALAAISLGSMTAGVTGNSIIQGLSGALDTMLPSAWTSSEPYLVGLWAQRMGVVMVIALLPMYLVWLNAEIIFLWLRQDPEVAYLAAKYLRWMSLGLPALAFNNISRRYFQSQGLFAVPTRIIFMVAPVNVLLNYTLVWGPEPIRLGFIGAPVASVISLNLVSLLSLLYGIYYVPRTAWHPLSMRIFTNLGLLAKLGLSGIGQTASEWWAWEIIAISASLIGPVTLASQSILLVSSATTYQIPYSIGLATSIRVGNLLGERNANRAGVSAYASIFIALVLACVTSTLYFAFRKSWAYMFNSDPEVVNLVASIIPILALYQVFSCIYTIATGILRAIGKQFIGTIINLIGYYVIGLPFGAWLAFHSGFGIHGLWIGCTVALIYCMIAGTWLCVRTNWDDEVKRAMERLKEEDNVRQDEEDTLVN